MSDQESLSFDPDASNTPDGGGNPSNRPAVGAKHARPSELGSEDWNQLGQGADFLGLGGDLATGQATPPPSELDVEAPMQVETGAAAYDDGLSLAEPVQEGEFYTDSYGNEIEYEEGAIDEFAPEEFGEEEAVDGIDFDERFKPKTRRASPVLATIAVAGLVGAGVVIGGHYMGYSPFQNLPFVEEPTETTASVDRGPSTAKTPSSIASSLAGAQGLADATETEESTTEPTDTADDALAEADAPTDPLVEQLSSEEGFQSAAADPGFEPTETAGENLNPVDTILGWFGEEEQGTDTEVADLESFGPEFETGEDGQWASADSAMLDPYEEYTEERRGTADFSAFAPVGSVDPTQTDYTQMDVVWRGEDVPSEMLHSAAKVLTPKVGPVRATTRSGEVFEGRLVAIGKRRVWLAAKAGEYALDGDLISNLERLPDSTTIDDGGTGTPAPTGKRVKAEAAGGVFYGRVLAVQGNKVVLVTDSGGRITLESPRLEAVSEGIQVRVKN